MAENIRDQGISTEPPTRQEAGTDSPGQNGMDQARERAQEYGDQARAKAQEYGHQAQEKADQGMDQAASGMERTAEMVRERTGGGDGIAAQAGGRAADAMENAAGYLRERDTSEVWNDVETYARSHPAQALAGAIFAGFLLGRIIR